MSEEILTINTVVKRDKINIDGKQFEIVDVDDLGPYEYSRLIQLNEESRPYLAKGEASLNPKEKRTVELALREIIKILVPSITPPVMRKLTIAHRAQIALAWAMRTRQAGESADPPVSRRTTSRPSRGSKRSTAATRKRGSTPRTGS